MTSRERTHRTVAGHVVGEEKGGEPDQQRQEEEREARASIARSRRPRVSVVIPTRDHVCYVRETLDSVFAQSFRDFEVIVIDDGSHDGTADLLRPLSAAGDLRTVNSGGCGVAAARNRGLELATGDLVALLDDDDLWPPDKLEWQVAALDAEPAAVLVYGFMETIGDQPGEVFPASEAPTGSIGRRFLERNWITSPGQTLIRAAALHAIGGFDATLWGADDWDVYLRLGSRGDFAYQPRRALWHRTHAASASRRALRIYRSACRVQHRHLRGVALRERPRLWCIGRWSILKLWCRQWAAARGFDLLSRRRIPRRTSP